MRHSEFLDVDLGKITDEFNTYQNKIYSLETENEDLSKQLREKDHIIEQIQLEFSKENENLRTSIRISDEFIETLKNTTIQKITDSEANSKILSLESEIEHLQLTLNQLKREYTDNCYKTGFLQAGLVNQQIRFLKQFDEILLRGELSDETVLQTYSDIIKFIDKLYLVYCQAVKINCELRIESINVRFANDALNKKVEELKIEIMEKDFGYGKYKENVTFHINNRKMRKTPSIQESSTY